MPNMCSAAVLKIVTIASVSNTTIASMADLTISRSALPTRTARGCAGLEVAPVRLHQALLLNRELALFLVQVDEDADLRAKDVRWNGLKR